LERTTSGRGGTAVYLLLFLNSIAQRDIPYNNGLGGICRDHQGISGIAIFIEIPYTRCVFAGTKLRL
jgi:hypothetical protein